MLTPITLTECPGLLDLMLVGDENGRSFILKGVQCSVERIDDHHAYFEAATPDFGLMMIFPGWYAGEHGMPVHILIADDAKACLQWLPIDRADKCAIIERLPLDNIAKTLLTLAV
jgi:hypothetical protein